MGSALSATVAGMITATLLVIAPAADAVLPGRDGAIAFDSSYEDGEDCAVGHDDSVFDPCTYSIYRVQPSGRKQKRLSPCGTQAKPACGDSGPTWSPDGRWIAFTSDGYLSVMRADGSDRRSLGVLGGGGSWSPDGRRIVYSNFGEVEVINADGTGRRTLPDGGFAGAVTWSSKNRLAFIREVQDRSRELVSMTPEGTDQRVLVPRCRCYSADFSPRGNQIIFDVGLRNSVLFVVSSRGDGRRRLLGQAGGPAFSPSGRYIAFSRGPELYTARSDGTGARRIPYDVKRRLGNDRAGDYFNPAWQPLPR